MAVKDYRVEVKVKNNLLYQAMIENGYKNVADLCRAMGTHESNICAAMGLKISLYKSDGEIRKLYEDLSKILHRLPEDLVPKTHHHEGLKKNTASFEADISDIKYLSREANPDTLLLEKMCGETVKDVLNTLTPRAKKVIEMRFGLNGEEPQTLAQVGKKLGVSRERVRNIESIALSALRKPRRAKSLKEFI